MAQVKTKEAPQQAAQPETSEQSKGSVALAAQPRLPYIKGVQERYGIDPSGWRVLCESVWPAAKDPSSIILALGYCKARRLDPFKRVIHIVPIWDNDKRRYVETVWPGVAELRTTAHRTGEYAGCDATEFGPMIEKTFEDEVGKEGSKRMMKVAVRFPEWAQVTVYRNVRGKRIAFPGPRAIWLETYGQRGKSEIPNDMWIKRSSGQLEKCAEVAALRKAFPEELGNEITVEELRETESLKDVPPRPTKAEVERELRETEGLRQEAARAAETAQEGRTASEATQVAQEPEEATQASAEADVQHDPETGEVAGDDGYAVLGVDDRIVWAGGDPAEFTKQLCLWLKRAASVDAMLQIYSKNAADIKRLTDDQKQVISDATRDVIGEKK